MNHASKVTQWMYIVQLYIVHCTWPSVTYAAVLWWLREDQKTTDKKHEWIRRLAGLYTVGMYRISGSGWLDIRPFFAIRFWIRPKYCLLPDSATG